MKKNLLIVLSTLFLVEALAAQSIKVITPKANGAVLLGSSCTVTWTFAGIPESTKVRIMLWRNGSKLGEIASSVAIGASGAGSWAWPAVGEYPGGPAAAGKGYEIRIRDVNNQYPVGKGDGPFVIETLALIPAKMPIASQAARLSAIAVTQPEPGQSIKPGGALWIKWDKVPIASYAQVAIDAFSPDKKTKLGQANGDPGVLISNSGSYQAHVFNDLYPPGHDFVIRIATPDEKHVGWSGVFHVLPPTSVEETITLSGGYDLSYNRLDKADFFGCDNSFGEKCRQPTVGYHLVGYENSYAQPFGLCWSYAGCVYRRLFNSSGININHGLKVKKAVLQFVVAQGSKQNFYILRRDAPSDDLSVPSTTVATVPGWGFGKTISVDLTDVVQGWCSGQTPYYGLIIRGNNESFAHNDDKVFCLITAPELIITKITTK